MKMHLTDKVVGAFVLPVGKDEELLQDDIIPGFSARIRADGSRTLNFQYAIGKKQRRLKLGRWPALKVAAARLTVEKLHAQVTLGQDPAGEKAEKQVRAAETFETEVTKYLIARNGTCRPSTYVEIERHLARNLLPLHGLHVDKVDLRAVANELERLTTEAGPAQANRTRSSLSKFFSWAVGKGVVKSNPAAFTNKNPERPRDRVLAEGELVDIWNACRDDNYGRIVRLLILTGQRRDEVAGMGWSELNEHRGTWHIPERRVKNGRAHTIALPALAWDIIKAVPKRDKRDFLFGEGERQFSGFSKSKLALDARILNARREAAKTAGIPVDDVKPMEAWRLHDLRRTVATMLGEELKVLPHVIEGLLNHVSGSKKGIAGIYNRALYAAEVKIALARWAEHLTAIVEGRESTVVPFQLTA
jgi:integrase